MEPETVIFMPNGDVTLIVTRHARKGNGILTKGGSTSAELVKQLPVDEDDFEGPGNGREAEPEAPAEPEESVVYYAPDPPGGADGPMYPPPPRKRGSDASSRRDRSASPPPSFWAALRRNARNVEAIEDEKSETHSLLNEIKEDEIVPSHEVHCVVSSQHLMLASEKMRTLLTGDSEQSRALQSKGHVTIRLAVDADTMVILLNIIHGASKKVPRQVSLEDLKRLATSVNVLGMLDTVEFFSDTWIENLKREAFPKVYNETVLSWLFISWVFNRPAEFKQMTKIAERESTERIQEDAQNISVPMNLIDAIKSERERAMKASITIIHSLIEQYLVSQIVCHGSLDDELRHACDAMVLGSLMKGSRQIGIWPMPDTPFKGKNFKDLAHKIRSIRILDVCNKTSNRRWNSHGPSSNCHGLEDSIETSLKSLEAGLDGLNISEYTKNSDGIDADFQKLFLPLELHEPKEQIKTNAEDEIRISTKKEIDNSTTGVAEVLTRHNAPAEQESPILGRIDKPSEMIEKQKETVVTPRQFSQNPYIIEQPVPFRPVVSLELENHAQENGRVALNPYVRDLQRSEAVLSNKNTYQEEGEEEVKEDPIKPTRQFSINRRDLQKVDPHTSSRVSLYEPEKAKEEVNASQRYSSIQTQSRATFSHEIQGSQEPEARISSSSRSSLYEGQPPPKDQVKGTLEAAPSRSELRNHLAQHLAQETREIRQNEAYASPRTSLYNAREPGNRYEAQAPAASGIPGNSPQTEAQVSPRRSSQDPKEVSKEDGKSNSQFASSQAKATSRVSPIQDSKSYQQSEIRNSHRINIQEVRTPPKEVDAIPGYFASQFARELQQSGVQLQRATFHGAQNRAKSDEPPTSRFSPASQGSTRHLSNQEPPVPRQLEARASSRDRPHETQERAKEIDRNSRYSPPSQSNSRSSLGQEVRVSPPEARTSPRSSLHEAPEQVNGTSRPSNSISSRLSQQPMQQSLSRGNIHETTASPKEEPPNSKISPSQAWRTSTTKDSTSAPTHPPTKSLPQVPVKEPVHMVASPPQELKSPHAVRIVGDRKHNHAPSFPNFLREQVKSPLNEVHLAPSLASMEEMIENIDYEPKTGLRDELKVERKESRGSGDSWKSDRTAVVDSRESSPTTTPVTEEEREKEKEMWNPKNFKIRKSKKVFSTRF